MKRIALGLAVQVAVATAAIAQQTTIRGRITDVAGRPVSAATVLVYDAPDTPPAVANTNDSGRFEVRVPRTHRTLVATITAPGYVVAQYALSGCVDAVECEVKAVALERRVQVVAAVVTRAERPRPYREAAGAIRPPGLSTSTLNVGDPATGDVSGNLYAALALVPWIQVTGTNEDGSASASAFGIGADQTRLTLNGATVGWAQLPRDALSHTVRIATYDPRFGRTAGLELSSTLASGTTLQRRQSRLSREQAGDNTSSLGRVAGVDGANTIFSSTLSGPLSREQRFYNLAFEASGRSTSVAALAPAWSTAFDVAGVPASSRDSLWALHRALDLPPIRAIAARTTHALSGAGRLDFTPAAQGLASPEGTVLYALFAGSVRRTDGLGVSPLSTNTRATSQDERNAIASVVFSPYLRAVLAETRLSISYAGHATRPESRLPSLTVWLPPASDSTAAGLFAKLGGSGNGPARVLRSRAELAQEVSWLSGDRAHRWNAFLELSAEELTSATNAAGNGALWFGSLDAMRDGRAGILRRTLETWKQGARAASAVIGFSDVYYATREIRAPADIDGDALLFQWGLRAELTRNAGISPSAATRMEGPWGLPPRMPTLASLSPMIGLTWRRGLYEKRVDRAVFSETRHVVTAGVRRYAGVVALERIAESAPNASPQTWLTCLGSDVPAVGWATLVGPERGVPTSCLETGQSDLEVLPTVHRLAPGFKPPVSWRGEASWNWLTGERLSTAISVVYAANSHLPQVVDLNMSLTPAFTIPTEAGRPVFVPADAVDPASGLPSVPMTRRVASFGRVFEHRSTRQSRVLQLTVGPTFRFGIAAVPSAPVERMPRASGTLRLLYSRSVGRGQTGGYEATTSGDPRTLIWSRAEAERDAFVIVGTLRVPRLFTAIVMMRAGIGRPYTPIVGGDLNGDGLVNDRAFLPAMESVQVDPSYKGLHELLRAGPMTARRCLMRQLGRIAQANSCSAPWSISATNVSFTLDPARLPFSGRTSLAVHIVNVLAGADRILHGRRRARGWGQLVAPDPVLLHVRGFDATNNKYSYDVNPHFGSSTTATALNGVPSRVILDLRVDWSRDAELQAIAGFRRQLRDARLLSQEDVERHLLRMSEGASSDLRTVLQLRDSLSLDSAQASAINALQRGLRCEQERLYHQLAVALVTSVGKSDAHLRDAWHGAIAGSVTAAFQATQRANLILNEAQLSWLGKAGVAPMLRRDTRWLRDATSRPQIYPR